MVANPTIPDLSTLRLISPEVMALCGIAKVSDHKGNGPGWTWPTRWEGECQTFRWKALDSNHSPKYLWGESDVDRPPLYDPDGKLKAAISDNDGILYLVGGEPAVWAMMSAGFRNTTCTFGDTSIPKNLPEVLKGLGVQMLRLIPDRDRSGLAQAIKIRNALKDQLDMVLDVKALPYELTEKHGKDVNDLWMDVKASQTAFGEKLIDLPDWQLPQPKPKIIPMPTMSFEHSPDLEAAVLNRLNEKNRKANPAGFITGLVCPFHDDHKPSLSYNCNTQYFHCFQSMCEGGSLWKTAEQLGIQPKNYFNSPRPQEKKDAIRYPVKKQGKETEPETQRAPAKLKVSDYHSLQLAPLLPDFSRLTAEQVAVGVSARTWVDDYISWAATASPLTPVHFHEAIALWLLALGCNRRISVMIGGEEIFPNLYLMLIAKTSLYRKSTAMNLAKKFLKLAMLDWLLLPTDVTPESLFDTLSGVKPKNWTELTEEEQRRDTFGRIFAAQRGFMKDEASSILASMKKEYNQGLAELIMQGYDGHASIRKLLKTEGLKVVNDITMSFLGATTPVMWAKQISNEHMQNGLVARFALLVPNGAMEYKLAPDVIPEPTAQVSKYRDMFKYFLPWDDDLLADNGEPDARVWHNRDRIVSTPKSQQMSIDREAYQVLVNYRKALGWDMIQEDSVVSDDKRPSYTRLGTAIYKIAMLLAASNKSMHVQLPHAVAAQGICETWRENLHRLDDVLIDSGEQDLATKVYKDLERRGQLGATKRELTRDNNITRPYDLKSALETLNDESLICWHQVSKGRGRPAWYYRAVELCPDCKTEVKV